MESEKTKSAYALRYLFALLTVIAILVILILPFHAPDAHPRRDEAKSHFMDFAALVVELARRGIELTDVKSMNELLIVAKRVGFVADWPGNVEKHTLDPWGNEYLWHIHKVGDGQTVFIFSLGAPSEPTNPSQLQPFVRIRLPKNKEPSVEYFDLD